METSPPPAVVQSNLSDHDPFATTPVRKSPGHRYSAFDTRLFSTYNTESPTQAKRALESYLVETDRRIQDASKLGTSLLQQRKDLADRLKEVEKQQQGDQIKPELRQKLADIEREYNEVGRETARAFQPKTRAFSAEASTMSGASTPLTADARHSPSKLHVPTSRKQRNQPSTRDKDLEFATEISASLLSQVRHLQTLLAERDTNLRTAEELKAGLEADRDHYVQRIKSLDESEQKYKDENWNLETQVYELSAAAKEAAAKEQRLTQSLNAVKAEKSNAEKEFEELQAAHNKLSEEHESIRKQHDTEISSMRRNISSGESERQQLARKVEELTSHNQDLARAVAYRSSTVAVPSPQNDVGEDAAEGAEAVTPEPSPPPSPSKGTPRHGGLESETLKSSLHHAHRMIQNLKNNIHREKTEKIELKRMLQDARDEIESRRNEANGANTGKKRRQQGQDTFKKPARPSKLGEAKFATEEVVNESHWEEYDSASPQRPSAAASKRYSMSTDTSGGFETANERETSDAFETANERDTATETEAFETGIEDAGDDSDELTETEDAAATRSRPQGLMGLGAGSRMSIQSTASDDADQFILRTPPSHRTQRQNTVRLRDRTRTNESESFKDSPASFVSNSSIPAAGQSLAAELEDLNDDGTSVASTTPGRAIVSPDATPELQRRRVTALHAPAAIIPQVAMVDYGMVTEPWSPEKSEPSEASQPDVPLSHVNSVIAPLSVDPTTSDSTDMQALALSPVISQSTEPLRPVLSERQLQLSSIAAQETSPTLPSMQSAQTPAVAVQSSAPPKSFVSAIASAIGLGSAEVAMDQSHGAQTAGGKTAASASRGIRPLSTRLNDDTIVAQDENVENADRTPAADSESANSQRTPFKAISGNARSQGQPDKESIGLAKSSTRKMLDDGTQTVVTSEQIDNMIKERMKRATNTPLITTFGPSSPKGTPTKRPGSAGSYRRDATSPTLPTIPPLPADHKKVIAAATSRTTMGTPGSMGPPLMSASAQRAVQNRSSVLENEGTTQATVRNVGSTSRNRPASLASRRSSVSSFASELDERFNMRNRRGIMMPDGFEVSSADPRMIQAITQTMIGEFLWKYTRKAGRGGMSEKRHRRFFWIHPYTRTLYWSDSDPSTGARQESKAKSVAIEAVRVVSDTNPLPPGLHNKSIVILTPGRQIKFTAPTAQRHETWFNALSYLLLRSSSEKNDPYNYSNTADYSADDIAEFNPGRGPSDYPSQASRMTASTTRRSLSTDRNSLRVPGATSYRGRSVPAASSSIRQTSAIGSASVSNTPIRRDIDGREAYEADDNEDTPRAQPTQLPQHPKSPTKGSSSLGSNLRRASGMSFASFRGRSIRGRAESRDLDGPADAGAPETMQHARDASITSRASAAGVMENVRACCDGKHDVSQLTHGHHHSHSHSHGHNTRRTLSLTSRHASASSRAGVGLPAAASALAEGPSISMSGRHWPAHSSQSLA